jgi:prophage tail gpP-like protein
MVQDSQVSIKLTFGNNQGTTIVNWDEYSFSSDFLTPCDAFTVKVSDRNLSDELKNLFLNVSNASDQSSSSNTILGGTQVKLELVYNVPTDLPNNTFALMVGAIDQVEVESSRRGTIYTLRGRNILAPLCDSGIDPWTSGPKSFKFGEGQKLSDVVGRVFNVFNINAIYQTDAKNRIVSTGVDPSQATITFKTIQVFTGTEDLTELVSKEGQTTSTTVPIYTDPTNTFDLSAADIKKLQPKENQTYMQFVEEQVARFHLHCWAMNDGSGVVIGKPDYSANMGQKIINRLDGAGNNVIRGDIFIDYFSQPTAIIAKGKQGGGDFQNTRIKTSKVNEFLGYNLDGSIINSVQTLINNFKGLEIIPSDANGQKLIQNYSKYFQKPTVPRILYWEEHDSATLHQLQGAVQRKMSQFQRRAFVLKYTLYDHVDNVLGIPWKHNTVVNVHDEELNVIDQPFWVQSVEYHKNRTSAGGTTTNLTLIPIGSLQF